ncbi:MAG TPA: SoxR reducing system RseC family protein [Bacteroidales bacterium]|mgnify:CR=1 FL=1|nr:SoxR reducing system RseC family protein [Bacteroidales bacterium]HPT21761.1 SoxR reducing system RseC family protein [Bacteroidales bacterium]
MKNSSDSETINHDGIVLKADDKSVTVSITSLSACAGCHAEGVCGLSGKEEKIINVSGKYNVKPGDRVSVMMQQSMGHTALLLGYILPLFLVVIFLVCLVSLKASELVAGIASVALLIPYYIILYFFRKRINRKFTFTLKV